MNNIIENYVELLQAQLQGKEYIMRRIEDCDNEEMYTLSDFKKELYKCICDINYVTDAIDLECDVIDMFDERYEDYISDIPESNIVCEFPKFLTPILTEIYNSNEFIFDDKLNRTFKIHDMGTVTIMAGLRPAPVSCIFDSITDKDFKGHHVCECGATLEHVISFEFYEPDYVCPNCEKTYKN